ncbi:MAG: sulfotransferase domain-containing protein [Rhodobacteraceae bacterium]|nr:sulfotransferase domain-containing protein [Paracoccaceae bacterium]
MAKLTPFETPSEDFSGSLSDPSRWDGLAVREGDIVVNTPAKSGATWVQSILAMLIAQDTNVAAQISLKSPWIDIKFRPLEDVAARLEAQDHRRQFKSHTSYQGLPWWSELRYISVYRHPLDVHFSYRRHVANMSFGILGEFFPDDPRESCTLFLEGDNPDAMPLKTIVAHHKGALARRGRENLLMLRYNDMQRDFGKAVRQIAGMSALSYLTLS